MIPRRTAEEKDIFFSNLGKLHFHRLDVLLWLLGSPSYVRHVFRFCALALFHALVGVRLGGQAAPSRDPTPWVRRGGEMRKKVKPKAFPRQADMTRDGKKKIDQMIEPLQPLKPQGDRGWNHSLIHYVLYITFIQGWGKTKIL